MTYLPTILMNLINQITNYITGDTRFDMVYTINITCMMVLASVYLSWTPDEDGREDEGTLLDELSLDGSFLVVAKTA